VPVPKPNSPAVCCFGQAPAAIRTQRGLRSSCRRSLYRVDRSLGTEPTLLVFERFARASNDALFPAGYRVPNPLRQLVKGTRIAIVNDVINAGSAVRGTFEDLEACGADIVAIGSLLTLGNAAQTFADSKNVALESLVHLPNNLWLPADCPLCATGVPLQDIAGFRNILTQHSCADQ